MNKGKTDAEENEKKFVQVQEAYEVRCFSTRSCRMKKRGKRTTIMAMRAILTLDSLKIFHLKALFTQKIHSAILDLATFSRNLDFLRAHLAADLPTYS